MGKGKGFLLILLLSSLKSAEEVTTDAERIQNIVENKYCPANLRKIVNECLLLNENEQKQLLKLLDKFNHLFGERPLECGYRFFYLGQGSFNIINNQVTTALNTGNVYANALVCSVTL